jgi:hypothetical protein
MITIAKAKISSFFLVFYVNDNKLKPINYIYISALCRIKLVLLLFVLGINYSHAQPAGYYNAATGLSGESLQTALHKIIRNHTQRSYYQLWTDFQSTDQKANGKVWGYVFRQPIRIFTL